MRKIAQNNQYSGISMTRAGVPPVRKNRCFHPSAALAFALSCASSVCHAQLAATQTDAIPVAPILREIEKEQKALPRTPDGTIDVQDKRRAVKPVPGLKAEVKA